MVLGTKIGAAMVAGVSLLLADVTIPTGGEEAIWLWRGFVMVCMGLAGRYLFQLHKKIEDCSTLPSRLEVQRRHIRALVRIMDQEADAHGRKRSTDHLVQALREEFEIDDAAWDRAQGGR